MVQAEYLKQPNVERPIFRNFEISNIEATEDELIDFSFLFLIKLFEHSKYMMISKIEN